MKNIIKSVIALTLVAGFWSCEDEQDLKFVSPDASFSILTPQSGDSVILDQAHPTNPGLVLSWEDMDYGTPTAVTYAVQVAANGTDFAEPITVVTTNNTFISIDSATLNGAALGAGLDPFVESALDVRIMSTVGTPAAENAYSDVINYLVTPYSSELPKLWVPGKYQETSGYGSAWTQADAPTLASSAFGHTDYEGYVYIATNQVNPTDDGMKFSTQANWDGTNYGDDGTFSGILSPTGSNILLNAGYYRIKADTGLLTYTATPTTWGIIGDGTAGGWDSDTPMTYNATTKKWEVIATLTTQAAPDHGLKFRANNDWGTNLGDTGADGSAEYDGTNIGTTAGTYLIELDLSNPRAYTYTLTAQ